MVSMRKVRRGLVLGLLVGWHGGSVRAQEPTLDSIPVASEVVSSVEPVRRVPNFIGDFFGRTLGTAVRIPGTPPPTRELLYSATNVSPDVAVNGSPILFNNVLVTGPGINAASPGPFASVLLRENITVTQTGDSFALRENTNFSAAVRAARPGAFFNRALATLNNAPNTPPLVDDNDLFNLSYIYLLPIGPAGPDTLLRAELANPLAGGLVGRNKFFENGSPVPRSRVYFHYTHLDDFQALTGRFDVNRCVFGAEQALWGDRVSVEVRVPFAGTLNNSQVSGVGLSADEVEFGNVGVAVKGVLFCNSTLVVSAGVAVSAPTAEDARLQSAAGATLIQIENDSFVVSPLVGVAWAPNDRVYAQFGAQFDIDTEGNPVVVNAPGFVGKAGILTDPGYAFLSGAAGVWVYRCDGGSGVTGVALQGELHYNRTLGVRDVVRADFIEVADALPRADILNLVGGVNVEFCDRARLAAGVVLPVGSDRLQDWGAQVQLNVSLGN